jgi:hypothetical protein
MTSERNPALQSVIENVGGNLGAVAAVAAASILLPEHAVVASISGAAIGTLATHYVSRGIPLPEPLKNLFRAWGRQQINNIITKKLCADFDYSVLRSGADLQVSFQRSINRFKNAHVLAENHRDQRIPAQPMVIFPELCWRGKAPDSALRLLHAIPQPIEVNCACIEVAAVAALKAMVARFGVNVITNFQDPNGYSQIQSVRRTPDKVDFLVIANAPFFLAQSPAIAQNFRLLLPLHVEWQYVFKQLGTTWDRVREIHMVPQSSAEEQVLSSAHLPSDVNASRVKPIEISPAVIPNLLLNLETPQAVLVWEPLASVLSKNKGVMPAEDCPKFGVWISLVGHKRWLERMRKEEMRAFQEIFLAAWIFCSENQKYANSLVSADPQFKEAFSLACGKLATADQ